jgi:hypothetical protein
MSLVFVGTVSSNATVALFHRAPFYVKAKKPDEGSLQIVNFQKRNITVC